MFVHTATFLGLQFETVVVEADIAAGLPNFIIVGLPGTAVREAKDRVRSGLKRSGFSFPRTRVTVNLAPASARKEGSYFDLPVALAILQAAGEIVNASTRDFFFGEVGLDGTLRAVAGALPLVIYAQRQGFTRCFLPAGNIHEVSMVQEMTFVPVHTLRETCDVLAERMPPPAVPPAPSTLSARTTFDMKDIHGQQHAKRACEIAAAGGHNLAMIGSPGSGKTLLARTMPSLLPPLTNEEMLETGQIHSIAGLLRTEEGLSRTPPFRSPHHSSSAVALIGGGSQILPGEISLAHHGILFLDELLEFSPHALNQLREPLEEGCVRISRAVGTAMFPAQFLLVAAMNPCPCGFAMDETRECRCSEQVIERYEQRLSGPLIDRIDMIVHVPRIRATELSAVGDGEPSAAIRARVKHARERQRKRFRNESYTLNKHISHREMRTYCALSTEDEAFFAENAEQLKLTARRMFSLLKVARTIADLAGSHAITREHCAEALSFLPPHTS
ncbi:MAG: YifB family Mg chelatase-like AAA ATPase [Candidatus Kerfeldbacteria bacterium]|nr:YifB family Mg chelatase-like AAA ATPase [Candidatus Kerfeldbacteria bacterium]